jgi:cbb3-type cytochrome oxidase subunit 3
MNTVLQAMQWLERYSIVLMMAVFIGIVLRTYWPGRKSEVEQQGRIPLKDDV